MTDRLKQFNRKVRQADLRWFDAQRNLLFGHGSEGSTELFHRLRAAYEHVGPDQAAELALEHDRCSDRATT